MWDGMGVRERDEKKMYAQLAEPYSVVSQCDTMVTQVISEQITTVQYLEKIFLIIVCMNLVLLAKNCRLKYPFLPTILW